MGRIECRQLAASTPRSKPVNVSPDRRLNRATARQPYPKDGKSMSRPVASWRILLVLAVIAVTGCHPAQPFVQAMQTARAEYAPHFIVG